MTNQHATLRDYGYGRAAALMGQPCPPDASEAFRAGHAEESARPTLARELPYPNRPAHDTGA